MLDDLFNFCFDINSEFQEKMLIYYKEFGYNLRPYSLNINYFNTFFSFNSLIIKDMMPLYFYILFFITFIVFLSNYINNTFHCPQIETEKNLK